MKQVIEIDSFNPYENLFPNRKLVDKDTLKLIKVLRQEGFVVVVRPYNDIPLQYLFKKGVKEFLADPVIAYLLNTSTTVVVTVLTNYIQSIFSRALDKKKMEAAKNNIIVIDNSTHTIVNINGCSISNGQVADMEKKRRTIVTEFGKAMSLKSPFPNLPTPLFIAHEPRIVGWCETGLTDQGLIFKNSRILDKNVFRKIEQGKIKGASLAGIAEESTCSICKGQYVNCAHISGDEYEGMKCSNHICKSVAVELSLVKEPVNAECLVQILRQKDK